MTFLVGLMNSMDVLNLHMLFKGIVSMDQFLMHIYFI